MAKIYRSTITTEYRTKNLMNFFDQIGDAADLNTIYLMFGRSESWSDRENEIDFAPPYPDDSADGQGDAWTRSLGFVKIPRSQLRPVIPRRDWGDPELTDSLRFTFGDIVVTNTIAQNQHPSAYPGYMVYRCLDIPETDPNNPVVRGTCSKPEITNKSDCVAVGGTWSAPESGGLEENIPHGTGNAIDTGDGYIWEYLYTIPSSDVITDVTREYIVVPTPSDIIGNRTEWGLHEVITFDPNIDSTIYSVGATQLRFRSKLIGGDFAHLFGPGNNGYRQINVVLNPLLKRTSAIDPAVKATAATYNPGQIEEMTGEMIYMENRQPITKTIDQVEEFNLIFQF